MGESKMPERNFFKLKVENGKLKIVVGKMFLLIANLIVPDHIYIHLQ